MIAAMLSSSTAAERDRLRHLGVPRSTYHAARRRAYAEGWLRDRYVPNPPHFGWECVRFTLARPYADRTAEMLGSWSEEPGAVVVWGSAQVAIEVAFHADRSAAHRAEETAAARSQTGWRLSLSCDARSDSIPVYFDFEGSWAHLSGAAGALGYPHGLGGPSPPAGNAEAEAPVADPRRMWAAAELLHRPFVTPEGSRSNHLVGPLGLPRSQQRLLASGWVGHRALLDPARVPPFAGLSPDQVVWITGNLRGGAAADDLFAQLTGDCRVYPFLYAVAGGVVLIGALGQGGQSQGTSPPGANPPRRPVMATLKESLEGIELIQAPASQMQLIVDHRYDRLLPRKGTT